MANPSPTNYHLVEKYFKIYTICLSSKSNMQHFARGYRGGVPATAGFEVVTAGLEGGPGA